MNRRVVVFGAGGQLGVELVRAFSGSGHAVTGFARNEADIGDLAVVERCLGEIKPGFVVNAAAYNLVDIAESEPEAAFRVNALAVRNLALVSSRLGAKLVHYSTDYVFDGRKGSPYVETDPPHPLGAYGVSKLAGEFYALAYAEDALVLRTCGVFGPGGRQTARGNFVETMLRAANAGKPLRVVADVVASPTYAPALADRTVELAERGASGVVHAGGDRPISWFDYAKLIFAAAGVTPELNAAGEGGLQSAARRPKFSALANGKMESLGVAPMPRLEDALAAYMQAVGTGKKA